MNKRLKPSNKIEAKQLALRKQLWPALSDDLLWHRLESTGFITIPRTMPLIMTMIDDMSKSTPAGHVYFDLFARSFDHSMVILNKKEEMAFHSGFPGQRAVNSWRQRMNALKTLGFIDIMPGPSGDMSYALIYNPYHVIKARKHDGTAGIRQDRYNALLARASDIGADDMNDAAPGDA